MGSSTYFQSFAVDIPFPEQGSLEVSIMVEAEEGMVAGAPEVAVVCRPFLPPVGLAHRAVHVQHDPRELPSFHDAIDPFPGEMSEGGLVLLRGENFHLEPAHLARGRGCVLDCPSPYDLAHRRIDDKPIGIVGVLVPGEAGEDRLPELCAERVARVLSVSAILNAVRCDVREAEGIVEFAIGEESCVRGDVRSMESQAHRRDEL
jgi:hypothetical protein